MRSEVSTVPSLSPRSLEMRCREMYARVEIRGWKNTESGIHTSISRSEAILKIPTVKRLHDSSERELGAEESCFIRKRLPLPFLEASIFPVCSQSETNTALPRKAAWTGKTVISYWDLSIRQEQ